MVWYGGGVYCASATTLHSSTPYPEWYGFILASSKRVLPSSFVTFMRTRDTLLNSMLALSFSLEFWIWSCSLRCKGSLCIHCAFSSSSTWMWNNCQRRCSRNSIATQSVYYQLEQTYCLSSMSRVPTMKTARIPRVFKWVHLFKTQKDHLSLLKPTLRFFIEHFYTVPIRLFTEN